MRVPAEVKSAFLNILVIFAMAAAGYVLFSRDNPVQQLAQPAPAAVEGAGTVLPDVTFYDEQDRPVRLADFKGQVILVNLWATWCPPCVVELPSLDTLHAKLRDRNFKVVAISLDRSDMTTVMSFLRARNIEQLESYWDKNREITMKWTYSGVPASFLIDVDGVVVEKFEGPRKWDTGPVYDRIVEVLGG